MARADLLLQLVDAALAGNEVRIRHTVESLVAEEEHKRHTVLAADLKRLLSRNSRPKSITSSFARSVEPRGYRELEPKTRLGDLHLPERVRLQVSELIEEQHRSDLLRAYGLEPRHRVLLVGPPGNGKTSCAEAIASELAVPLVVLKYEEIITSYLGETGSKLAAMLDDVRRRHCVLFIDEFDALAKERGDEHDAGEMKRIVSTLLLQLDDLPSHVVLCAATNHHELLDRAVWRRFDLRLSLPNPNAEERAQFISAASNRIGLKVAWSAHRLADDLGETNYAELENFLLGVKRRQLLNGDLGGLDTRILSQQLQHWKSQVDLPRGLGGIT